MLEVKATVAQALVLTERCEAMLRGGEGVLQGAQIRVSVPAKSERTRVGPRPS